MDFLQNASPEQVQQYLYEVAQNRQNVVGNTIDDLRGTPSAQSQSNIPFTERLFADMMNLYSGVKQQPMAFEQQAAETAKTQAKAESERATADVSKSTVDARIRAINADAASQELDNKWQQYTEEGRKQLFDYQIEQAAITSDLFKQVKDAELEHLDSKTQYNLAQAALANSRLNQTEGLDMNTILRMQQMGIDVKQNQIANTQRAINALSSSMDSLNSRVKNEAEAELRKMQIMQDWLLDPQQMYNSDINTFIENLPSRPFRETPKEENIDELLREYYGFDRQGFEAMRANVFNIHSAANGGGNSNFGAEEFASLFNEPR
jgi:hypothetical protein